MEPITRFIELNFGLSFLVGVVIVSCVLSGVIWLSIWLYKIITKHKDLDNKINMLPCGTHNTTLDKHSASIEQIDETLDKLDKTISSLPCGTHNTTLDKHSASIEQIEKTLNKLDKTLESIPCLGHKETIEKHENHISKHNAILNKMAGEIELLVKLATSERSNLGIGAESGFEVRHSPRQLNEIGQFLFNKINGDAFLKENSELFLEKIKQLSPKAALDVENFALAVLEFYSGEDIFIPIKDWVYNAPIQRIEKSDGTIEEKDIRFNNVLFVLSLPLRDMYLEKYPFRRNS